MIFITLGSQKFQFNRLLKEIDRLVECGTIQEEVFAQIGYSDYVPKNIKYKQFLDRDEFSEMMKKCEKVITHGGTGAIIGAIKQKKKVIAVPRLEKFGEHVDDHQLQITKQFKSMNFIETIDNIEELSHAIQRIECSIYNMYVSNTSDIVNKIDDFINNKMVN